MPMKSPRLPALLLVCFGCALSASASEPTVQVGLQCWTYQRLTFVETIDRAAALGIRHLQADPRQKLGGGLPGQFDPAMTGATREKILSRLAAKGVAVTSFFSFCTSSFR